MSVALFPSNASFPCRNARSASTSHVSRPARRLLALQPAHSRNHLMTLYIGGFSRVVAFPPAPIATGWSDPCREGLAPSQEPCLSTAHVSFVLSPVIGLSCHRHPADMVCPRPVGPTSPPLDLTPASRRQDHTTSPYAATSLVRVLLIAHRPFANPPCNPVARKTLPRPPHPSPRP